jgi:hypothetical protein
VVVFSFFLMASWGCLGISGPSFWKPLAAIWASWGRLGESAPAVTPYYNTYDDTNSFHKSAFPVLVLPTSNTRLGTADITEKIKSCQYVLFVVAHQPKTSLISDILTFEHNPETIIRGTYDFSDKY